MYRKWRKDDLDLCQRSYVDNTFQAGLAQPVVLAIITTILRRNAILCIGTFNVPDDAIPLFSVYFQLSDQHSNLIWTTTPELAKHLKELPEDSFVDAVNDALVSHTISDIYTITIYYKI